MRFDTLVVRWGTCDVETHETQHTTRHSGEHAQAPHAPQLPALGLRTSTSASKNDSAKHPHEVLVTCSRETVMGRSTRPADEAWSYPPPLSGWPAGAVVSAFMTGTNVSASSPYTSVVMVHASARYEHHAMSPLRAPCSLLRKDATAPTTNLSRQHRGREERQPCNCLRGPTVLQSPPAAAAWPHTVFPIASSQLVLACRHQAT